MTDQCKADTYRRFWLTVIHRAVQEARGEMLGYAGDTHDDPKVLQREAQEWLSGDSWDLRVVCFLAGMTRDERVRLVKMYKEMYARPN